VKERKLERKCGRRRRGAEQEGRKWDGIRVRRVEGWTGRRRLERGVREKKGRRKNEREGIRVR
jgi:hypothetical protein